MTRSWFAAAFVVLVQSVALLPVASRVASADDESAVAASTSASDAKPAAKGEKHEPKFPEWNKVIEGAKHIDGLFPLYFNQEQEKLFMAIRPDQYEQELVLPISIARGAGMMFLGGDTLNFGNQWIISFRRAADRILVVRRNVKFKAEDGSPQADAVKVSYTDSIIDALPVKSEQPDKRVLIDLADLFMTDLAGIGVRPDHNPRKLRGPR